MIIRREPPTGDIRGCTFRVAYPESRHYLSECRKAPVTRALECLNRSAIVNQQEIIE